MPQIDDIRFRRGTAALWTSTNPILNAGEPGIETDTNRVKYGDGITAWVDLAYAVAGGDGDMVLADAQAVTGVKTFSPNALLIAGATSGAVTLNTVGAAGGTLTLPNATDTIVGKATTDVFTNKSISGASNTLTALPAANISGVIPIANLGTGTPDGSKYLRDDGTLQTPAGSGDMILATVQVITAKKTFGAAGAVGKFAIAGTTSGFTTLDASPVASGTLTLPTGTDTLIARDTIDTVTNKSMSGADNTFTALPAAGITGVIPIANLATGVATGSKFIRDDGTLQAIAGGGDALVASPLSQFAPTTSAQLLATLSDPTGTGLAVFATSPSFTTPVLGVAAATTLNKVTITAPATGSTLTIPNGVVLTGPAASGTAMTLGNAEAVTGVKTFGSGKVVLSGSTSGTTTVNAGAIAGTTTLTLPVATDTLTGKATTDTFTNKTYDTAGTGNSLSINGVAVTANTGTGSVVRATSPTLGTAVLTSPTINTTVSGTATLPATITMVATPAQADNSTKIATTAYVDTLGATKATPGILALDGTDITASRDLTAADFDGAVMSINAAGVVAITVPTVAAMSLAATSGNVRTIAFFVEGAGIPTFAGATASTSINGTAGTTTVLPGSSAGVGGAAPVRYQFYILTQTTVGGDGWSLS